MARRIRRNGSGVQQAQRIAHQHVTEAIEALERRWPPGSVAIHSARKSLKRARAALRLVRPALGERQFGRENAALGAAARPLSAVRDAVAIRAAYDRVMRGTALRKRSIATLRTALQAHEAEIQRRTFARSQRRDAILERLRSSARRIDALESAGGWGVLGPGLRRLHRSCRKALAGCREDPTPTRLHDWRKRAKSLWYALEMLQSARPGPIGRLVGRLHQLTDDLGEDHDLAVLRRRVEHPRYVLAAATRRVILDQIDRRRYKLQAKAMALGGEIFEDQSRAFERRIAGWWKSWRSG